MRVSARDDVLRTEAIVVEEGGGIRGLGRQGMLPNHAYVPPHHIPTLLQVEAQHRIHEAASVRSIATIPDMTASIGPVPFHAPHAYQAVLRQARPT